MVDLNTPAGVPTPNTAPVASPAPRPASPAPAPHSAQGTPTQGGTIARTTPQQRGASMITNVAPVVDPDVVVAPAKVDEDSLSDATRAEMDAGRKALGRHAPKTVRKDV